MIDLDIYKPNQSVEEFLKSLKLKLNQDHPAINVYISTANPYMSWSEKLYNFYNNTKLTEVQNDGK